MSDVFGFNDDPGFPANDTGDAATDAAGGGFASPDFSGLFAPTSATFPLVTQPQSLPAPSGGIGGALNDVSNLVTRFYAGVTQATVAKSAADLAQARAANALTTVKTAPNIWLVAGIVGAGFFALELMDRK